MRSRSFILLALALGCGAIATVGISQVMERNRQQPNTLEMEQIFVALNDIATGELFTPQNTKLEEWPKSKIPQGSIVKFDDLQGKRAKFRILQGEAVLALKVTDQLEGAVKDIPKGYRVVAVSVNQVSMVGNLVLPGNLVDVIVHLNKNPSNGIPEATTRKVLNAVKVFSVGAVTQSQHEKEEQTIVAQSVGLLVTPKQAQALTLASELGQIRLSLRSSEDAAESNEEEENGVDVSTLLGSTVHGQTPSEGNKGSDWIEWLKNRGQAAAPTATSTPVAAPVEPTPPPVMAPTTYSMTLIEGESVRTVEVPLTGEITASMVVPPLPGAAGSTTGVVAPIAPVTPLHQIRSN